MPGPSVEKGFSSPEKTSLKTFREHPAKLKEPGQGLGLGLSSLFSSLGRCGERPGASRSLRAAGSPTWKGDAVILKGPWGTFSGSSSLGSPWSPHSQLWINDVKRIHFSCISSSGSSEISRGPRGDVGHQGRGEGGRQITSP